MTGALLPPGSPELLQYIREFRHAAFRLETLQEYGNSGEDDAFAAFLAGESNPPRTVEDDEWEAMIRGHVAAGRIMRRVHVVIEPLTDYMRFELTWAYAQDVSAGEDIRIIAVQPGDWPVGVPRGPDFWLFDSQILVEQVYDQHGTWLGCRYIDDPELTRRACVHRDIAVRRSIPWADYVHARPGLVHRLPTTVPTS